MFWEEEKERMERCQRRRKVESLSRSRIRENIELEGLEILKLPHTR